MPTKNFDGFFEDLNNTMPYLKVAAHGLAGGGKTRTLANIAGGLHVFIKSDKPIVIYDTEKSAKFLKPFFNKYGIQVIIKQSRSLTDLMTTMDFCDQGGSDILIIDSITHVWESFLEAYKRQKNRTRLQFQDWSFLKPEWKKDFSDRVVMAEYHVMFSGRQGDIYDYVEDADGKRELVKTGVKMKAEAETAYEPDLLLMMEAIQQKDGDHTKVVRRATVLKDRSDIIDGKEIINPRFEDIKPVVEFLLSDVKPKTASEETPDDGLIKDEDDRRAYAKERDKWVERFFVLLDAAAPNTNSQKAKKLRMELKDKALGETSDLAIGQMPVEYLESGTAKLKALVAEMESAATDAA